jgi:tripartite-type tricarboxylate transporter receptor subunit TctC
MKAIALLSVALATLATFAAQAQDESRYPQRAVKIVVNVAPGRGVDAAARVIAQKLGERFGQTFVVENRGGGSGNIAAEAVYHAEPDGYTLLAAPGATISINDMLFKKLGYDPLRYEPVSILTSVPLALVVRQSFPARTFQEFLPYARANPGKLNYASNGVGTAAHLTAELLMLQTGVKMVHVPYKGTNPVLNDILAGQVDLTFIQYSAFLELYKAGRVQILAIANPKRVAALSEVPTLTELGFAELVSNTWNILAAPPATPRAVLNKLNRAVDQVLQDNDVRTRFSKMETTVEGGSLEDARTYVAADRERWKKVIASAGIEAE